MAFMPKYTDKQRDDILDLVDKERAKGYSIRDACKRTKCPYPAYTYWDRKRQGMPTSLKELRSSSPTAPERSEEVVVLSGPSDQIIHVVRLAEQLGVAVLTRTLKPTRSSQLSRAQL